jgi:hypothetical protein
MNKINLVRVGWTDLNSSYLEWILQKEFDLNNYNNTNTYNKDTDILVVSRPEFFNNDILIKFLSDGFRVILANLWEARPFLLARDFEPYLDNILVVLGCKNSHDYGWKNVINVPNWFWYNESLWYTCDKNFQYQNYVPNRTNTNLFFMPIKRSKQFRTAIVERFENVLDRATWSYVERLCNGKHLVTKETNPVARIGWDRQFEAEWYDDTYFTVAVETYYGCSDLIKEQQGLRSDELCPADLFITEKTYKPIAHQHPFMLMGMPGTLAHLRSLGFETYDHLFDESYDTEEFFEDRLEIIYNNIINFDCNRYLDPLTEQKIKHNYNKFYDRVQVLNGIDREFIVPTLEWIHAT